MSDYFYDERPGADHGGDDNVSWGGESGGSSGNSGSWGGGSGVIIDPSWWWQWSGSDKSAPYLKISPEGHLLTPGTPYLLKGLGQCNYIPAMLVYLETSDRHKHARCVLCKLSDPGRGFVIRRAPENAASAFSVSGYISTADPGTFELQIRWQGGHYDYSKMSRMRFILFGVDMGWRTVPLSGWINFATITITDQHKIYVNGVLGSTPGNTPYLPA